MQATSAEPTERPMKAVGPQMARGPSTDEPEAQANGVDRFQEAVRIAQSLCSPSQWQFMEPSERSALIYRQLRRIDLLQCQGMRSMAVNEIPRENSDTTFEPAKAA